MAEQAEAVVVGAGPAGLAVAACLAKRGISALVVERNQAVGSAWRNHYHRLHLHTPRGASTLPGMTYPEGTERYPSRDQVVAYLDRYAETHGIAPRFGAEVTRVWREDDLWRVSGTDLDVATPAVVVATGYAGTPAMPSWPGLDGFSGPVVHSSQYKDGEPYRGKRVLVVGFGNSAGEIAICLHEHGARPGLSVRGPVTVVPRDLLGMPILSVGVSMTWMPEAVADRVSYPLLAPTYRRARKAGLELNPYGPFTQIKRHGRIPLLDIGTLDLLAAGAISLHRGIERIEGDEVVFEGGEREPFDALILATGFRSAVGRFLDPGDDILDADGYPRVSGKPVPGQPGLFFCGFYLALTGMLREIAREAPAIAEAVANLHNQGQPRRS